MTNFNTSGNKPLEQNTFTPTFKLALWEYAYQKELESYWGLVTRKAKRIKQLEIQDNSNLHDRDVERRLRHLNCLHMELDTMVGFKLFTDNLKTAYLETSSWLADYTSKVHKENLILKDCLESSRKGELFYLKLLINVLDQLDEKGVSSSSLKNIEL